MRHRTVWVVVVLTLGILGARLSADAQKPAKVPRIGVLEAGSGPSPVYEAFRQGLREIGYVEGQNIIIEHRSPQGIPGRLPNLAAELVDLKVDVIVTHGPPTIRAAQQATKTIPIVMAVSGDPVGEGFVASLARPGGNTTGLSIMATELSGKRLELLKEAVPGVTRVAVLMNPANRVATTQLKETQAAARALEVKLQPLEVRNPNELDSAFLAMIRESAGAVIVLPDALFHGQYKRIAELAAKHRLPAMFWWREFAEAGGLMAYGADRSDLGRRTAGFVDKILKGAKPADLPVEQPTRFELVVNLKTAKALGLTIPQSILIRADHVIP